MEKPKCLSIITCTNIFLYTLTAVKMWTTTTQWLVTTWVNNWSIILLQRGKSKNQPYHMLLKWTWVDNRLYLIKVWGWWMQNPEEQLPQGERVGCSQRAALTMSKYGDVLRIKWRFDYLGNHLIILKMLHMYFINFLYV